MPSDRESLLAEIIANPDEDTPRLAFADLVEEEGDPVRAAYIRWSCGQGPTRPIPVRCRPRQWFQRWWTGETRCYHTGPRNLIVTKVRLGGETQNFYYVERGFIDRVYLPWATWRNIGPWLVEQQPVRCAHAQDIVATRVEPDFGRYYLYRDGNTSGIPISRVPQWLWMYTPGTDGVDALSFNTFDEASRTLGKGMIAWAKAMNRLTAEVAAEVA